MSFPFKDPVVSSPKKDVQKRNKGLKKGFGSRVGRFVVKDEKNPGVGAYEFDRGLIVKSPSQSTRGNYASKCPQISPHIDQGVPSPMHYNVICNDMNNAKNAVPFSPAGINKGKVPWAEPLPNPGPLSYPALSPVQLGASPFIERKQSATFSSATERNSFFDIQSPAPGPAKYNILGSTFKGQHDLEWSRSKGIRFEDIDRDNGVPPPTQYFDEKRDLVKQKKRESLRSSGYIQGTLKGKQNERPKTAIHTFGADVDRFKNSTYGRLDLAALIPAPGYYDDIFRYSINGGKGRVHTAHPNATRSGNNAPPSPKSLQRTPLRITPSSAPSSPTAGNILRHGSIPFKSDEKYHDYEENH